MTQKEFPATSSILAANIHVCIVYRAMMIMRVSISVIKKTLWHTAARSPSKSELLSYMHRLSLAQALFIRVCVCVRIIVRVKVISSAIKEKKPS